MPTTTVSASADRTERVSTPSWAIVRLDTFQLRNTPSPDQIARATTVVSVHDDPAGLDEEVARLNRINGPLGSVYTLHTTRNRSPR